MGTRTPALACQPLEQDPVQHVLLSGHYSLSTCFPAPSVARCRDSASGSQVSREAQRGQVAPETLRPALAGAQTLPMLFALLSP